jgi:hypothetical protein
VPGNDFASSFTPTMLLNNLIWLFCSGIFVA